MSNNKPDTQEKPLDDILMAMDVVDTLRHSSRVVERELHAATHDESLVRRLREIYGSQGIDVPDHILQEGVVALREDRFVYVPTPASSSRRLAEIYVRNHKMMPAFILLGALGFVLLAFLFLWPLITGLF